MKIVAKLIIYDDIPNCIKEFIFRSCLNLYRQVFYRAKLDVYLYFKGA